MGPEDTMFQKLFVPVIPHTTWGNDQCNHDVGSLPAWKQDRTPSTSSSGADMAWARVVGTSHNDTLTGSCSATTSSVKHPWIHTNKNAPWGLKKKKKKKNPLGAKKKKKKKKKKK